MFDGHFLKALQDEFHRVFELDATAPVLTATEKQTLFNFGFMYLMGPLHGDSK